MSQAVVVVPCFNEARRLDLAAFEGFARAQPDVRLLLVDDGSTDNTFELLEGLRERLPESFEVLRLERNSGKAEAVRRGLLRALDHDPSYTRAQRRADSLVPILAAMSNTEGSDTGSSGQSGGAR